MNSTQRKYLVDKISDRVKRRILVLEEDIPEAVSLNVYMLHRVMSNDFSIKPESELKRIVLEKALKTGREKSHREDWLGNAWGSATKGNVAFEIEEFFEVPEEYKKMVRERKEARERVYMEISELKLQLETLEIRIMLASDKNLQTLINEVDDMGDISLIDTKIKLLSN